MIAIDQVKVRRDRRLPEKERLAGVIDERVVDEQQPAEREHEFLAAEAPGEIAQPAMRAQDALSRMGWRPNRI